MLAFVTTDVDISKELLQEAVSDSVKDSFNMISVDGDTSTNDTLLLDSQRPGRATLKINKRARL